MNIYELYGRQAERLQELVVFHGRTLQLLREIQDGTVTRGQLVVTQAGWELQDDPVQDIDSPPATVNYSKFREVGVTG